MTARMRLAPAAVRVCVSATLVTAALLPALAARFGQTDDYVYLECGRTAAPDLLQAGILMGRPIAGFCWRIGFPLAGDVAGLAWLRATGGLLLAALALMIDHSVRRRTDAGPLTGMALALTITLTPACLILAAWATCFPFPLAAILGIWSGLLATGFTGDSRMKSHIRRLSGALVPLVAACAIYQPAAMFFWLPAALRLLTARDPARGAVRMVTACGIVAALALCGGLLIYRLGPVVTGIPNAARGDLCDDPLEKAVRFLAGPAKNLLLPWTITPHTAGAIGVFGFIACGFWCGDRDSPRSFWTRCALAGLLLALASLPVLLTKENQFPFRTLAAPVAIAIVTIWQAMRGFARRFPALSKWSAAASILCVAACVGLAHRRITDYIAHPQTAEWRFVCDTLAHALREQAAVRRIVLVRPKYLATLAPEIRNEFGMPSSFPPLIPEALVREALHSLGHSGPMPEIEVVGWSAPTGGESGVVIDVARFLNGPG